MEEFALIRLLREAGEAAAVRPAAPNGSAVTGHAEAGNETGIVVGIGDDAAVCQMTESMQLVLTCDSMVETIHFNDRTMRAADVGHKAMASNLSDLAAMGAVPRYALVALSAPKTADPAYLQELYTGLYACASLYGTSVVGGDTTSSPGGLTVTVTVTGEVETGRALLRSAAQPGDRVFVTGHPGCSAAGLHWLLQHGLSQAETAEQPGGSSIAASPETPAAGRPGEGARAAGAYEPAASRWVPLIRAHQRPEPRVSAGRALLRSGLCGALNDVSDGVASEAWEISEASGCRLTLREEALPLHPLLASYGQEVGVDPLEWLLYGGEDYELLGTVPAAEADKLEVLFGELQLPLHYIGDVVAGHPGVELVRTDGRSQPLDKKGYNHFA